MPKVSVIIPVYGVEQYIERCARALFEQTLDDIEYLFIDDCTSDKSIDYVKQVLEDYPNRKTQVTIHRMDHNSGQARVREWGMRNATGDYIIHCDSDDWVDRDMYRQMYEKAVEEGAEAEAVICDYYIANENEEKSVIGVRGLSKQLIIADILSDKIAGSVWNKMFARKLYDNGITYPQGNMGEDAVLSIQLLKDVNNIAYVNKPLYFYYYNHESITKGQSKKKALNNFTAATQNARIVVDFLAANGMLGQFKKELVLFKFREKSFLVPYLEDDEINVLWRSTFPETNLKILFSRKFSTKEMIKYVLFLTKLNTRF